MEVININTLKEEDINEYNEFMNQNKGTGSLNIRCNSASLAIPISNVNVIVSHIIDNKKVIFFEGFTDDSGMINGISLPTPIISNNDLIIPPSIIYNVEVIYIKNEYDLMYNVVMYSNQDVVQNINITKDINEGF